MSNRLQVGGLALIIKPYFAMNNVGKVVELLSHTGEFLGAGDCWYVRCESGLELDTGVFCKESNIQTWRLMPLGDQKGVEMFELEKETENESTAKI